MRLWDEWKQTAHQEDADRLFRRILDLAADGFEVIGTVSGTATFGTKNRKLRNVPASIPLSWEYATPGPSMLQQYYFVP
jgi:peptide/nickel transport system substrate-binding protein